MNAILLISMPGGQEWFFILVVPVLWLWSLIDCIKSDFKGDNKLLWILGIVLIPFLGAVSYLVFGRNQKINSVN